MRQTFRLIFIFWSQNAQSSCILVIYKDTSPLLHHHVALRIYFRFLKHENAFLNKTILYPAQFLRLCGEKKNIKEIFPAKIGRIRCSASVCVCLRERADEKGFERHLVHCSCLGPEYRNPFIRRGREGGKKGGKEGAHWLK